MKSKYPNNIIFKANEEKWAIWSKAGANGRVKEFISNSKRLRILELPAGFNEEEACLIGHQGLVLTGNFIISVDGEDHKCCPGDFFSIPDGIPHKSRCDGNEITKVFVVDNNCKKGS